MMTTIMDRDKHAHTHGSSDLAALSERNEALVGELQSKVTQLRMQVFQLAHRDATLREEAAEAEVKAEAYKRNRPDGLDERPWWMRW